MSQFYKWRVCFEGDENNTMVSINVTADYHDVAVEKAWYILGKIPTPQDECYQIIYVSRIKPAEKDSDLSDWEISKSGIYESECPYAE